MPRIILPPGSGLGPWSTRIPPDSIACRESRDFLSEDYRRAGSELNQASVR